MDILKYKTIVIKIGSSRIVDGKNKKKKNWFNKLIENIIFLIQKKKTNYYCFFRSNRSWL